MKIIEVKIWKFNWKFLLMKTQINLFYLIIRNLLCMIIKILKVIFNFK